MSTKLAAYEMHETPATRLMKATLNPLWKAQDHAGPIVRKVWGSGEESVQAQMIEGMQVDEAIAGLEALIGPDTQYVEVLNEVNQRQGLGLEGHCTFLEALLPKWRARHPSIGVIAFCFSVGNPGVASLGDALDDMQYLFNRNYCGLDPKRDGIGLHAYWQEGQNPADWQFRYRAMHAAVPPGHPPFFLTEGGREPGWRLCGITKDQYKGEILAFTAEIEKDAYVRIFTPFAGGTTKDWWNYDTDELNLGGTMSDPMTAEITRLENYATSLGVSPDAIGNAQVSALEAANGQDYEAHEFWVALRESSPIVAGVTYPAPDAFPQADWPPVAATLTPPDGPTQGGQPEVVDPNDPVILGLKKQIADFTELGRRVTEGHYNGLGGSAAIVLALEGTQSPIAPQPDYVPK